MRGLSVLICAYQAEKTLMQCVRSVLDQGIDDLEILIVNDGSTDKTAWMADFLKEQYSCIRVIHQTNRGIACARNRAIQEATKEWILFLDSDDTLCPNALKRLMITQKITKADLVCSAHRIKWKKLRIKVGVKKMRELDKKEGVIELLKDAKLKNYVWGKLFHRKLFDDIVFPEGMLFEDVAVMAKLLLKSERTVIIPEVTVNYTVDKLDSITSGLPLSCLKDYELAMLEQTKQIEMTYPELKGNCQRAMWKIKMMIQVKLKLCGENL